MGDKRSALWALLPVMLVGQSAVAQDYSYPTPPPQQPRYTTEPAYAPAPPPKPKVSAHRGFQGGFNIGVPIFTFAGTVGDETKFINQGGKIANFDATAGIGAVTLRGGVVHFNGRPLSSPEARRLAAACGIR